jgi:hypothetical protein
MKKAAGPKEPVAFFFARPDFLVVYRCAGGT